MFAWIALEALAFECPTGLQAVAPPIGAAVAPANVVPVALFFGGASPAGLELRGPSGPVAVETTVRALGSAVELRPTAPLAPGEYTIGAARFTVTADVDAKAPRAPVGLALEQQHATDPALPPIDALVARWEPAPDAAVYEVVVLDRDGNVLETVWTGANRALLGQHPCTWTNARLPLGRATVKVRARDLAGNWGPTSTETVYFAPPLQNPLIAHAPPAESRSVLVQMLLETAAGFAREMDEAQRRGR